MVYNLVFVEEIKIQKTKLTMCKKYQQIYDIGKLKPIENFRYYYKR